jgi:ribonucleotide reductase beta subunit family protein with ferritin-like domain
VKEIIEEGVIVAKKFICEALPCRLIGMNENNMSDYIEYVSDRLLVSLGYNKIYNKNNPFTFMESIGMVQKTNFFESRPTEYQSAHVMGNNKRVNTFEITDDF